MRISRVLIPIGVSVFIGFVLMLGVFLGYNSVETNIKQSENPVLTTEIDNIREYPTPIIEIYCDCSINRSIKTPEIAEEPSIIEEEVVQTARYGFTDEEVYLLAQLVCGDGRIDGDGEYDVDFQININYTEVNKVLCVVMNRVRDKRFPNSVEGVVLAHNSEYYQFAVFPKNLNATPSDKALEIISDWCEAYDNWDEDVDTIPANHIYFSGDGNINHTRAG